MEDEKTEQTPEVGETKTEQIETEPVAEPETTIVSNASEGYGYNYASLADMARAGVKIPRMRLCRDNPDYLEFWDGSEWQLGAKIVQLPIKSMNVAQAYGAALTYARRYTVQMAQCVACDDDKSVEDTKADGSAKTTADAAPKKKNGVDFGEIRGAIKKCATIDELRSYWATLTLTRKQEEAILPDFLARKKALGAENE